MKVFIYLLQYIFINFLFIILKILPLNISKKLLASIFRLFGKLTSAHKTAIKNCAFVFPNFTKERIKKTIDKSWNNIGETVCELLKLEELFNKDQIKIKGLKNIENLKNRNSQAIFISIHQSNWEVLVPMLDRLDIKIGGIYRHINNI